MPVLNEVNRREISVLKNGTVAYVGEGTGVHIGGIGEVIIIADDKDKVCKVFEMIRGNLPDKHGIRKVAVIPEENIEV